MATTLNRDLPSYDDGERNTQLSHFTVQGFDIGGVVHAGAHNGGDIYNYLKMGIPYILAFEPLSKIYDRLTKDVKNWPDEIGFDPIQMEIYPIGLHDRDGTVELKITGPEDEGQSSTIMEHFNMEHPQAVHWDKNRMFVDAQNIVVQQFFTWLAQHPDISLTNYDTLHLDTQGNEYEVLKGMGHLIQRFKYLCIELSSIPAYIGQTPAEPVVKYLEGQGFMLDSPVHLHGDSFFIRADLKSRSDKRYLGRKL